MPGSRRKKYKMIKRSITPAASPGIGSEVMVPRYYQKESYEAAFRDLKHKKGSSPLIVLPTGTGKSFVIALMAKHMAQYGARTLILSHKQELVTQNQEEMLGFGVDCGTLCAGVGHPDVNHTAVSASIQTMHSRFKNNPNVAGSFKLILVDEAHMVNNKDTGRYRELLKMMAECMPGIGVVGLTATPFRTGQGYLTSGEHSIFSHICYEYGIKQAISDGYLCPVITPPTSARFNVSGLKIGSRGDYTEDSLRKIAAQNDNTHLALDECLNLQRTENRHGVIIFGATKAHCYEVERYMQSKGEKYYAITDDTSKTVRRKLIKDFKDRKIKGLISRDILTTGFNARHVDLVCFLRKTASLVLWIQSLGRGMRILKDWEEKIFGKKINCMVADFCSNVGFHPAIDSVDLFESVKAPVKREAKKNLDEAVKTCSNCTGENRIYARRCEWCDTSFSLEDVANHVSSFMSSGFIISPDDVAMAGSAVGHNVFSVLMSKHPGKGGKPPTLRVDYNLGISKSHKEFIPIGRTPFNGVDPVEWTRIFFGSEIRDVDVALQMFHDKSYKKPKSIKILKMGKYNSVFSYSMGDDVEHINPMFKTAANKPKNMDLFK